MLMGLQGKRICLFGAHARLGPLLEALPKCDIRGLLDNDAAKHGASFSGLKASGPEQFEWSGIDVVVITSSSVEAISRQLQHEYGVDASMLFVPPKKYFSETNFSNPAHAGLARKLLKKLMKNAGLRNPGRA